jgi:hypothetical protein
MNPLHFFLTKLTLVVFYVWILKIESYFYLLWKVLLSLETPNGQKSTEGTNELFQLSRRTRDFDYYN